MKTVDDMIASELFALEDFISKNLHMNNKEAKIAGDIIRHLTKSGGKRMRPKLLFLVCKMLNYSGKDAISIAAAIEFIHNATLLHDDVLDESEIRHGIDTANKIWGNKLSILVGDLLLTIAFRWLIQCGHLNVLSVLSEASYSLVSGEIKQINMHSSFTEIKEEYFDTIEKKTASLFSACCEAASIISGSTTSEVERLRNFGHNFGMAFQIIDDVLDYTTNAGKVMGKDFSDRKITLPIIIAYEQGTSDEQDFWRECFFAKEHDFHKAIEYIHKHNSIHLSIEEAKRYSNIAKSCIDVFPDSHCKNILINFVNINLERQM